VAGLLERLQQAPEGRHEGLKRLEASDLKVTATFGFHPMLIL
jgi:hypothetical protein